MSKLLLLIFAMTSVMSSEAMAQSRSPGGGGVMQRRAEQREASRWTLQEWLDTRDRNRMMDLWLAFNSSSPYEAMFGAAYKTSTAQINTPTSENSYVSSDGYVTAHASLVGLTFEYENNQQEKYQDVNGMLNLRLFGTSIQSTYLAVHYGQRTRTLSSTVPDSAYKNQFAQVSLQLYLMKYFGIDGSYRHYFPNTETKLNQEIRGNLSEVGAFIDFKAVRVFGSWYQDLEISKSTLTPFDETITYRQGTKAGLKLYF